MTPCEASNCSLHGDPVEGRTRTMFLCENHRHLVNFTPERHARWERVAQLVRARFHPNTTPGVGRTDLTYVEEADGVRTLAVRFKNDDGVLTVIVVHEEFGFAWGQLGPTSEVNVDNQPILVGSGSDLDLELREPDRRISLHDLLRLS